MSKRGNFYRRDPARALSGMIGLSLEERGVYNTVIDLLYMTWRPIEDDRRFIANWCGCAVQKINPIINRLIARGRLITFEENGRTYLSDEAFEAEREAVKGASEPREGRRQVGEKSGEVGEKSVEVGEKSPGVDENSTLLDADTVEKQQVTPLDKSRVEEIEKNPPIPPSGGRATSVAFEEAWRAWHTDAPANRGKAEAWAEWGAIADPDELALLRAVRAHLSRLQAGPPQTRKAFHRWLRDRGFEAYLTRAAPSDPPAFDGPPEIWSAVVAAKGEPFAVSYLTRCRFENGTLTTSSATTFDRLKREVGAELDALGVRLLQGAAA